jgi:RimJ/RimL family protein N-acetyltransferase
MRDSSAPSSRLTIKTRRLVLRPFTPEDSERVAQIQSNWNVIRMLRAASHPATAASIGAWLKDHRREWQAGVAYRFAVTEDGRLLGCADLDEIRGGRGHLGYWFDQCVWGRGLATEAARAVVDWGFGDLKLQGIDSGCARDNPASVAVLAKLGFRRLGETRVWSNPRRGPITQLVFALEAPSSAAGALDRLDARTGP